MNNHNATPVIGVGSNSGTFVGVSVPIGAVIGAGALMAFEPVFNAAPKFWATIIIGGMLFSCFYGCVSECNKKITPNPSPVVAETVAKSSGVNAAIEAEYKVRHMTEHEKIEAVWGVRPEWHQKPYTAPVPARKISHFKLGAWKWLNDQADNGGDWAKRQVQEEKEYMIINNIDKISE